MTIKGVSESFVETLRTNTALIRKYVKDEKIKGKVMCVSSTEQSIKNNKNMVTSMMMVPSVAGIYAASYVINNIIKENK